MGRELLRYHTYCFFAFNLEVDLQNFKVLKADYKTYQKPKSSTYDRLTSQQCSDVTLLKPG